MKVAKAKAGATDRAAFTPEQIQKLFTELTDNSSKLVKKESHKWATLLAMFTGARLNEICQIEIADIQQTDGIWVLNITDEGENNKRLKARASKRQVPLHSELIRLGFPAFIESRKEHTRLFHDYSYETNGG
ncbi:tyrosine-type recombinase/integrase [Thalassobius sp. I31.1]|uniref:tyrosine-type recombinase/integrase n=1 Tax=Thalassobius sp. I31.1 TaxID=2109912 RepID=UPI00130019EF|nr:tyrosine-type recombinase/integrase [Thalassobius sp. I31.1]